MTNGHTRKIKTAMLACVGATIAMGAISAEADEFDRSLLNQTEYLQSLHNSGSGNGLYQTAISQHSNFGVGAGISYKLKFGNNVSNNKKFGSVALNFQSSYLGGTAQMPLAELSFGESSAAAQWDQFNFASDNFDEKSSVSLKLLGIDYDRLSADDASKNNSKSKTDLGDIGLLAGGVGILLIGGTVAILAAD